MGIRLAGVDAASGRDCGLGLFLPYYIVGNGAVSGNEAAIVAAVLPVEGSWTSLTIAAQPDVPRTLNCEISVDAAATDLEVIFRVRGITSYGERVEEDVTVSSVTTVETNYAFRQVDSIQTSVTTPTDVDATDRIRVGYGPTHGSPIKLGATTDVVGAYERVVDPGTPSAWAKLTVVTSGLGTGEVLVDTTYHTLEFGDVPASGQEYLVYLQSTYNALDTTR